MINHCLGFVIKIFNCQTEQWTHQCHCKSISILNLVNIAIGHCCCVRMLPARRPVWTLYLIVWTAVRVIKYCGSYDRVNEYLFAYKHWTYLIITLIEKASESKYLPPFTSYLFVHIFAQNAKLKSLYPFVDLARLKQVFPILISKILKLSFYKIIMWILYNHIFIELGK